MNCWLGPTSFRDTIGESSLRRSARDLHDRAVGGAELIDPFESHLGAGRDREQLVHELCRRGDALGIERGDDVAVAESGFFGRGSGRDTDHDYT